MLALWGSMLFFCPALRAEPVSNESDDLLKLVRCGPNALFMFFVLRGHTNFEWRIFEEIPVSEEGTSLQALRDTGRKFGVDTEVRKYQLSELHLLPLPAIVQLVSPPSAPTKNHFSIIFKVERDYVHLIDGTTGQKMRWQREFFCRYWTRVALTERRIFRLLPKDEQSTVVALVGLLAVNCWLFARTK